MPRRITFTFTFTITFFSAIKIEKDLLELKTGIEGFDKEKLTPTPTVEKNTLPTQEVIEAEKTAE